MNIKDVTNDWVMQNFDIKKERKTKTHRVQLGEIHSWKPGLAIEFDTYLKQLDDEVTKMTDDFMTRLDLDVCKIFVEVDTEYDYEYSSDHLNLIAEWEAPETDKEVIARVRNREKGKLRRAKEKAEKEKSKEAREKREYERLRKKFENIE